MLERTIERLLFASSWLLAPLYLGLSVALLALGIKFFDEAFHAITHVMTLGEADLVLIVLALIEPVIHFFGQVQFGEFFATEGHFAVLPLIAGTLMTTLVALRIAAGLWMTWRHATGGAVDALADCIEAGGWTGVAGVFLGYALAYTWGLRARLSRVP